MEGNLHISETLTAIVDELKTRRESAISVVDVFCSDCGTSFETLSIRGMIGETLCNQHRQQGYVKTLRCNTCNSIMPEYVFRDVDKLTGECFDRYFRRCEYCQDDASKSNDTRLQIYTAWRAMVDKDFQETEKYLLPLPEMLDTILAIPYGKSIFSIGKSYLGKTRCNYERCRVDMIAGRRVSILRPGEFATTVSRLASDSLIALSSWIKTLHSYDVIFLDDLGKERYTERVETELFTFLYRRFAERKVIYITSNEDTESLKGKFTDRQKGESIVNRIIEHCQILQFK